MCGIAGIASPNPNNPLLQHVEPMLNALIHRGPDDAGEFRGDGIALGFRRLAIIDLSPAGHQPMTNEDGTLQLVFNGEIYNFQALRQDLQGQGHVFRSATDSETILHAYETYGEACLDHFRGMFAFALWDGKQRKLFFARDRFGKKPFFYALQNGTLVFASEIGAVRQTVEQTPINAQALNHYLRLQFIPSPNTIFQGINKLPPAHYGVWQNGRLTIRRYWSLALAPKLNLTEAEAGTEFERLLRESVKLRLVSDVPLGVFLSGGLDSSIITALVAEETQAPVKTFSLGFVGDEQNELSLAKRVAKRYATDHHEFLIEPTVAELLPRLMRHYGEPFADSSAIATYLVARETRRSVTVALTGDGGDENLAGYDKYAVLQKLAAFDRVPQALRKLIGRTLTALSPLAPKVYRNKARVGGRLFAGTLAERYNDLFFLFTPPEIRQLLSPSAVAIGSEASAEAIAENILAGLPKNATLIDQVTALDLGLYLPEGLMTKADIATMAVSLEARAPFLDHKLVEFTARLPDHLKIAQGQRKYLLRKQLGHLLPPELLQAPKHGFGLPVNRWLRGDLLPMARDLLFDPSFRSLPYFRPETVKRLWDDHQSRRGHYGIQLWSLVCFAHWHNEIRR